MSGLSRARMIRRSGLDLQASWESNDEFCELAGSRREGKTSAVAFDDDVVTQ